MSQIDEIYFPHEKEERRRFRQRQTALSRKCRCGNCISRDNETGLCSRCVERERQASRQRVLDNLADRILEGEEP